MNTRKELKLFLENWNKYVKKPLNEALGDTNYDEMLSQLPPAVAEHFKRVAAKYFIFDKESFDVDEQIKIKKEVVATVLKKNGFKQFPLDHIFVSSPLAERDYETGATIRGTSGKSTPAEQIASSNPGASGYIVYDNLSRGLGEIEKGLARFVKSSNPELKAKLDRMAQLSKTSAEYKKLDGEVKAQVARLNIQTMKVGETGEAAEVHGSAASKSATDTKSGLRGWREARNIVYQSLLKGTGALLKGTHGQFKQIIGKYPHLAYTYNDMEKFTSADTDMKKATPLTADEAPELSTVKDVRTIYIAPLLKLEEQGKELSSTLKALTDAGDTAGAMEMHQELIDLKKEMNEVGVSLWPFISKVKKELVACLDEMKALKTGDAYTFKLGQSEQPAEQEQPAAPLDPASESVIKIFDFDGTLFNTSKFFESSGITQLFSINFYMTYLKPSIKRSFLRRIAEGTNPLGLAEELKKDPEHTYIVTSVASNGVDKKVEYFAYQFQKKDETIIKFLQFLNQNREDSGSKSPEETYSEIYPANLFPAAAPQKTQEPAKSAEEPKKATSAQATEPASTAPKYPSREDFRKNTKVAKDYKKWAYESGTEEDQLGYEADRDSALDDNDHYTLDESKNKKVKSLKEQLAGLRLRIGPRK